MLKCLWLDEGGAVLSTELILLMVVAVIGVTVGMVALRDSVAAKLVELSAAVATIDPGYGFGGIEYYADPSTSSSPDSGWVAGSSYESTMASVADFGNGDFEPAVVLESEAVEPGIPPAIASF